MVKIIRNIIIVILILLCVFYTYIVYSLRGRSISYVRENNFSEEEIQLLEEEFQIELKEITHISKTKSYPDSFTIQISGITNWKEFANNCLKVKYTKAQIEAAANGLATGYDTEVHTNINNNDVNAFRFSSAYDGAYTMAWVYSENGEIYVELEKDNLCTDGVIKVFQKEK